MGNAPTRPRAAVRGGVAESAATVASGACCAAATAHHSLIAANTNKSKGFLKTQVLLVDFHEQANTGNMQHAP